ncbi:MAG TPA: hypothetical protein VJC16_07360 [Candidatus Nanoarchaeia archaeon]|nr:hypothetical protein [Candidatus Nanoarchaeia archaeon]
MQFKIEKKENPNIGKYSPQEMDLSYQFAEKAYKEFQDFLKCIVLFGSKARKAMGAGPQPVTDIDVLIIIDDTALYLSEEVVQTYRVITEKLAAETSDRLHITTLQFTHFWDLIRNGDPIAINMLRDGIPLLDTSFFEPLQVLLKQGRIRPTAESVWSYFGRTSPTLFNAKWHLLQAGLDLYWAVIDAAHAALMYAGEIPPSPAHVADLMQDKLVNHGLLEKRYPQIMRRFYELSRKIVHRELQELSGREFDAYFKEAEEFVSRMRKMLIK